MKKFKNLINEMEKINAPVVYKDGCCEESLYKFVLKEIDGRFYVYDENEQYHIHWLEDTNYELQELAKEFNRTVKSIQKDYMRERLENALKLDLGNDAYFEWSNNVVMVICE